MDWLRQLPIGQYVQGSGSWLLKLDPRLKLAWTVGFLVTPILAGPIWRLGLVALLLLLTVGAGLPLRLWGKGVGLLLTLAVAVGLLATVLPTGNLPAAPLQRPAAELRLVPGPPQSAAPTASGAAWELWRLGPLQVTRQSLELGISGGTLLFTLVHSANLMLLTTSPEQLVWAIDWWITPLGRLGLPAARLGFILLLALRFLPLVQEELQNLLRALATRAVVLKRLGWRGALGLLLAVGERLLANVLLRAEQGADALIARGGHWLDPMQLHQPQQAARRLNAMALIALLLLGVLRWKLGDL